MQTERMTMAQALVRFLNQQYVSVDGDETPFVEGVATIFGHGNVLGIGQALEQDPGHLQVMQGCNEQGIAHMATGFAKQHRRQRIFAVTSSVGPGAANMVTAAATATANRIPLLLLPGTLKLIFQRKAHPLLQALKHGLLACQPELRMLLLQAMMNLRKATRTVGEIIIHRHLQPLTGRLHLAQ